MKFEREEITLTKVPNTKTISVYKDGVLSWYEIKPNEGYMLHHKARDYSVIDEETGEQKNRLGYGEGVSSCPVDYDFAPATIVDENGTSYTAYGSFEFFAKERTENDAD